MNTRKVKTAVVAAAATVLVAGLAITQAAAQPILQSPEAAPGSAEKGGLVNKGPINPDTWVYGHANDDTTNAPLWNPVKKKMNAGDDIVGGTAITTSGLDYCRIAKSGVDFTWTEMQHAPVSWETVGKMWRECPSATVIGARVAYTDEREIQHALDEGAMVLVVPTVDTVQEAREVVQWSHYPPMGRRSQGNSQAGELFYTDVPGGYRETFNKNLVTIVMVETLEGVQNARKIAEVPGVDAVFAASSDLGNFSGYQEGDPDYEKLITAVHDRTLAAGKRLCGPDRWMDRPGFSCFQSSGD